MDLKLITEKDFKLLLEKIDFLTRKVEILSNSQNTGYTNNDILSKNETCKYLKISSRTLQNYRDKGLISFHQEGAKITFQFSDIQQFLKNNKIEAFDNTRF